MNKIVGLSQINKSNMQNIIKIGKNRCEMNNIINAHTFYAKNICKNCSSFVCYFCVKNNRKKCIICSQSNKYNESECGSCKHKISKFICHLCGDIINRCYYRCENNMEMHHVRCQSYFIRCTNCKNKKCDVCEF